MNGLEADYGNRMAFRIEIFNQGENPQLIEEYELGIHGMVITDESESIMWAEKNHNQTREGIEAVIKDLLDS